MYLPYAGSLPKWLQQAWSQNLHPCLSHSRELKLLSYHLPPPRHVHRELNGSRVAETANGTTTWGVGILGIGLTCCTTVAAPLLNFCISINSIYKTLLFITTAILWHDHLNNLKYLKKIGHKVKGKENIKSNRSRRIFTFFKKIVYNPSNNNLLCNKPEKMKYL